jgi:AcrR family transcriptional regulator
MDLRSERANATREAILDAAEQLFAERGLYAVSNRQVSEAAGQGNNAAVGYHFGTKTDLVRAIIRRHGTEIARLRREMVAAVPQPGTARDWISCWVRPVTEHLGAREAPTWLARFSAQLMADPAFRDLVVSETGTEPEDNLILEGLNRCCPPMPVDVRLARNYMTRQLIVHLLADCERVLAEGNYSPWPSWQKAATGLIDALVGLWLASVTPSP